MPILESRRQRGLTLLELIVSAALMTTFALGVIQFISVFYQYRLSDMVSNLLMAQSARAQSEFRYICRNATQIRIYPDQASRGGAVTETGNYFEADFSAESNNGGAIASTSVTTGIEFVLSTKEIKIWYYGTNSQSAADLCLGQVYWQSGDLDVFGFQNHLPYFRYQLGLPMGSPNGRSSTIGEYLPITAWAKPLYMR